MTTETTPREKATRIAAGHVEEIADLQRRIGKTLSDLPDRQAGAAERVRRLEEEMADHEQRLRRAITRDRANAERVADALAEHRVRTGDLGSETVRTIERRLRNRTIYPAPYSPIESPWALTARSNF